MFSLAKASVAVLALASFAQATITIGQPNIKGNSTNTITWTSSDANTDPEVFSIELINQVFNSQFALANNVQTSQGSITFQLPVVAPGSGYTIEFVNIGNINSIISTSAPFSVQENDVSSTSSATGASSSVSGVASRTSALSTTAGTLTQSRTAATSTAPASVTGISSAASTGSAASGTSATASASVPTKSNAAMELIPSGFFAAFIASAIALLF